jgi:hypothetical protein
MSTDLTSVFVEYLAGNRGPVQGDPEVRQAPNYGLLASWEADRVQLQLVFRSGSAYCCYELGCHLLKSQESEWEWLRKKLFDLNANLPLKLELHVQVVVEEGALFFDLLKPDPSHRGHYSFTSVSAKRYERVLLEPNRWC